jgi:predicted PurR-regulated permease PerM
MLGFDRRAARYAWTTLLVIGLVYAVYLIRKTLFVFVLAVLFAYLLSPLVNLLDRFLPSRSRAPALALSYLLFLGALTLAGFEIGSRVIEQGNAFMRRVPDLMTKLEQPSSLPLPSQVQSLKQRIVSGLRDRVNTWSNELMSSLPKAGAKVVGVAGNLVFLVIVPILAFFFLKDGREIIRNLIEGVGHERPKLVLEEIIADVHILLAHYMRALLILCAATFAFYSIFFSILGVPYAILLASAAAALEFIPMVGPLTAAVLIVIVAMVNGSGVIAILIFLGVYRVFQDYVLSPQVMGSGVELHPLLVIFGVFAGGEIAGVPGTFLSVPVLALLRIVYRRLQKARASAHLAPAQLA